jgi:CheY-like chemotaxis protein
LTVPAGFDNSLRPGRILVADPDADTRQLYHVYFESFACDVIEATDGREALAKALTRVPTLIVTELWLPGINGFALCEILRTDSSTRGTPILIATSEARPEMLQQVRDVGADAVLVKPVLPDVLFEQAHRLIEQSRTLRSHLEEVREEVRREAERNEFVREAVRREAERNQSVREASIKQRRPDFRRNTTSPPAPPRSFSALRAVRG